MKKRLSLIMIAALVIAAIQVVAGENKTESTKSKELTNQTQCPVMGGKIDSTVFTDIQGQRVYHCCPACGEPLKADPDKYFQKASAEGVLFENIQTTCPVSGEMLQKKNVFSDHEGRRVYFCCEMCVAKFEKDPGKYLGMLDMNAKESESSKESHEGHSH